MVDLQVDSAARFVASTHLDGGLRVWNEGVSRREGRLRRRGMSILGCWSEAGAAIRCLRHRGRCSRRTALRPAGLRRSRLLDLRA